MAKLSFCAYDCNIYFIAYMSCFFCCDCLLEKRQHKKADFFIIYTVSHFRMKLYFMMFLWNNIFVITVSGQRLADDADASILRLLSMLRELTFISQLPASPYFLFIMTLPHFPEMICFALVILAEAASNSLSPDETFIYCRDFFI